MNNAFIRWAAVCGALAVILGAFGAHALKAILPPESLMSFETGVKYQMYHALALLGVGLIREKHPGKWITYSGHAFLIGIILFSGSLYLLTLLRATSTVGLEGLGLITPVGGLFLIAGWLLLLAGMKK
jgi:uncharacterized membrane protein YgdD (TMEM256/DUF423 family)